MNVYCLKFGRDLNHEVKFAKSAIKVEKVTKDATISYFSAFGDKGTIYGVVRLWKYESDNSFLLEVIIKDSIKIPVSDNFTAKDVKDKVMQILSSYKKANR